MTTIAVPRLFEIFQGSATTAQEVSTILGLGPTGDATARRRLVHPEPASFAPILYFQNPDRTWNLDNDLLYAPITAVLRALDGSAVTRFEEVMADVLVTELWVGSDQKFSMPAFFFRQLYEYLLNPPTYNPANQAFIQYSPQDKNTKTWNVELIRLAVGAGTDPSQLYDINEFFPRGSPLENLDAAFANEGSGLLDRSVMLQMKIVSEVT